MGTVLSSKTYLVPEFILSIITEFLGIFTLAQDDRIFRDIESKPLCDFSIFPNFKTDSKYQNYLRK